MKSWTMKPYTDIDGLRDIVLEESYVLGITATPGLLILMDFVLTPDHRLYRPHGPENFACFRHGELRFQDVKSLQWSDQIARPSQDATGELDWGHIDSFEWKPGCYRLDGEWEWGIMEVTGGDVQVTVHDTDSPA